MELPNFFVVDHPLVQTRLTEMRRRETPSALFRHRLAEIARVTAVEALRDLPLGTMRIETPITVMEHAPVLAQTPVVVAILRAGLPVAEVVRDMLPGAPLGMIGLRRDPQTLRPIEYLVKLPPITTDTPIILCDPMLATGGSAANAVDTLRAQGARNIRMVALVAAPEGVRAFHARHPEVRIWAAALDERLDEHGHIVPGLGDAGDRIFGTE